MKVDVQKLAALITIIGAVAGILKFAWPFAIQAIASEVIKYI